MPERKKRLTDAQRGQILRDFLASGKSQVAYAKGRNDVEASTLGAWLKDAEKYGIDAETVKGRGGRIQLPRGEVKKLIDEWLADPLGRSANDFTLGRAEPIAHRTMQNWLNDSERYGVSQKTVDACKAERKGRVAPIVRLTDTEKRDHILGFMNQKDPAAEYARRQHLSDVTFLRWLRKAEKYGLNQELVDLAVQNRTMAYGHGSRQTDRLLLPSDGLPPLDAPEPAGAYGYSGTAEAGPSHQEEGEWRQESPPQGYSPQEYSPEDTFEYPSNVAVSSYALRTGFGEPQADEASSDQRAQADQYAQFLQAAGAGQLSASHFALPDTRTYRQHELPKVSRHDAAKDATKKGKSSRHRH